MPSQFDLRDPKIVLDFAKLGVGITGIIIATAFYFKCTSHVETDWMFNDHIKWTGKTAEMNSPENLQKFGWRPADAFEVRR